MFSKYFEIFLSAIQKSNTGLSIKDFNKHKLHATIINILLTCYSAKVKQEGSLSYNVVAISRVKSYFKRLVRIYTIKQGRKQ